MAKKQKAARRRGKVRLSEYFKILKNGDRVAIVRESSHTKNFPDRMQGRTGVVEKKIGKVYYIKVKDHNQTKHYLVEPIHLKKIEVQK